MLVFLATCRRRKSKPKSPVLRKAIAKVFGPLEKIVVDGIIYLNRGDKKQSYKFINYKLWMTIKNQFEVRP